MADTLKAAVDNRANQLNPIFAVYSRGRGFTPEEAREKARFHREPLHSANMGGKGF